MGSFFSFQKMKESDLRPGARDTESSVIATNVAALIDGNGKDHTIVMPTAIYVELLGILRGKGRTPALEAKSVNKAVEFLEEVDFLFADLDEHVVDEAVPLIAKHHLTGIDASLLATASLFDVRKVYTIDRGLLKVANSIPGVSVELPPPPMTLQLDIPS
ncbi:PIN domain-containing protein [Corynebacterium felinum]|uniref:PIN domain-containing protein n=1 Tax=Corynebacterium felinum TaxID=131318 RepID=UPI0025B533E2|nr:PIN domain-containing protein [Corynebacterium felinum]